MLFSTEMRKARRHGMTLYAKRKRRQPRILSKLKSESKIKIFSEKQKHFNSSRDALKGVFQPEGNLPDGSLTMQPELRAPEKEISCKKK